MNFLTGQLFFLHTIMDELQEECEREPGEIVCHKQCRGKYKVMDSL